MAYTHAKRKQNPTPSIRSSERLPERRPSMDALRAGQALPTAEQKGRRVDLPDAMRAKMETSFGADLSAVKLYESEAVADAGARAVTRGSEIAFAPGMLDFSSFGGQALLGHELSHVVSQTRGEVSQSGGFLNDHALEARADREGAMAAAGQQIAMPAASMSSVSAAPAAGPMQAKKKEKKTPEEKRREQASKDADELYRLEMGGKTDPSDRQRRKIQKGYDRILNKRANIELYRELGKRRLAAINSLGGDKRFETSFTRERRDQRANPEKYEGEGMLQPGPDEYYARLEGAWSDDAVDVGAYGQLMGAAAGSGPAAMDAYLQYKAEEVERRNNNTQEEKDLEERGLELFGGLSKNPFLQTENGKKYEQTLIKKMEKRAGDIYYRRNKKKK